MGTQLRTLSINNTSSTMKLTLALVLCAVVVAEALFPLMEPCQDSEGNTFNNGDTISANRLSQLSAYKDLWSVPVTSGMMLTALEKPGCVTSHHATHVAQSCPSNLH